MSDNTGGSPSECRAANLSQATSCWGRAAIWTLAWLVLCAPVGALDAEVRLRSGGDWIHMNSHGINDAHATLRASDHGTGPNGPCGPWIVVTVLCLSLLAGLGSFHLRRLLLHRRGSRSRSLSHRGGDLVRLGRFGLPHVTLPCARTSAEWIPSLAGEARMLHDRTKIHRGRWIGHRRYRLRRSIQRARRCTRKSRDACRLSTWRPKAVPATGLTPKAATISGCYKLVGALIVLIIAALIACLIAAAAAAATTQNTPAHLLTINGRCTDTRCRILADLACPRLRLDVRSGGTHGWCPHTGVRIGEAETPGPDAFVDSDVSSASDEHSDWNDDEVDDDDPWRGDPLPGHPSGPKGTAERKIADDTWRIIADWMDVAKLKATEPSTAQRTADPASHGHACEIRGEQRDYVVQMAARHDTEFIQSDAFVEQLPGFIFSTRVGQTGYYRDVLPPPTVNAQDCNVPPRLPISLAAHLPTAAGATGHARDARPRMRQHRRRFHGPLAAPPSETSLADDTWVHQGCWVLDSLNSNAFRSAAHTRATTRADVLFLQETKVPVEGHNDLLTQSQNGGWHAAHSPAHRGEGNGRSGGVAVLARLHLGMEHADALDLDEEQHRVVWAYSTLADGCILASVYLRHSEGLSPDNRSILEQIAATVSAIEKPWIIAGDFNMEHTVLAESGWLDMVGGVAFAPKRTCGAAGLDFFVVSRSLASSVQGVQLVSDTGTFPHAGVRLIVRAGQTRRCRRVAVKPTRIPGTMPHGPRSAELTARDGLGAMGPMPRWHVLPGEQGIEAMAAKWEHDAREYLCVATGRTMTTHSDVAFKWKPINTAQHAKTPAATCTAAKWRSAANAVNRCVATARREGRSLDVAELWNTYRSAARLLGARGTAEAMAEAASTDEDATAKQLLKAYAEAAAGKEVPYAVLTALAAQALRHAREHDKKAVRQARENFKEWLSADNAGMSQDTRLRPAKRAFAFVRSSRGWGTRPRGKNAYNRTEDENDDDVTPDDPSDTCGQHEADVPLSLQGEVELEADRWASLWQEGQPSFDPPAPEPADHILPITADDVRDAALTFKADTGCGLDNLAPRALAFLPWDLRQRLATILELAERSGTWPERWGLVNIVLLPKPDGGRRPIGLFQAAVRVWMRIRAPGLRQWEHDQHKDALHGGQGSSASRAAWLSAWEAEDADLSDEHYAQALLDLEKAFETVPHEALWHAARKHGYPLSVLRLALKAYVAPRVISCDGAFSRKVKASRGITAGSGTATAELRALLLDLIDELATEYPDVTATFYVDDANLETRVPKPKLTPCPVGISRRTHMQKAAADNFKAAMTACNRISGATTHIVRYFEEKLGMIVSAKKSKLLASSPALAKAAAGLVAGRKVTAAVQGNMLGFGTTAGKRRTMAQLQARVKKFAGKRKRIITLRACGISSRELTRAIAMPAIGYGLEATGIGDSRLHQLRGQVVRTAHPGAAGGNLDCEWYAYDAADGTDDPAFQAHLLPLHALSMAWWEQWRTQGDLSRAHRAACDHLTAASSHKGHIWTQVRGPTAAAILTAERLGWSFKDARNIIADCGRTIDLARDPPAYVKRLVIAAVRRWRLGNVLQHFHATRGLVMPAVGGAQASGGSSHGRHITPSMTHWHQRANVVASLWHFPESIRGGWSSSDRKAAAPTFLASAMAGRQWPQAKCAAAKGAGWVADPTCRLCNGAPGTLAHRHSCPKISEQVPVSHDDSPPANGSLDATDAQRSTWQTRGIGAVRIDVGARSDDGWVHWLKQVPSYVDMATIDWYVDASQIDAQDDRSARYGAGLVGVDTRGCLVAAAYGCPPRHVDNIPAAEAWAIWLVLANTPTRRTVHTDCQSNLTLLRSGARNGVKASNRNARVWGSIFAALDGDEGTAWLTWMPAHTAKASIGHAKKSTGEHMRAIDWLANRAVDALAKAAAAAERLPKCQRLKILQAKADVKRWRTRLARVTTASQRFAERQCDERGAVRTTLKRDSDGKPSGNTRHEHPRQQDRQRRNRGVSRSTELLVPHDAPTDAQFMAGLTSAPFATDGPVVPRKAGAPVTSPSRDELVDDLLTACTRQLQRRVARARPTRGACTPRTDSLAGDGGTPLPAAPVQGGSAGSVSGTPDQECYHPSCGAACSTPLDYALWALAAIQLTDGQCCGTDRGSINHDLDVIEAAIEACTSQSATHPADMNAADACGQTPVHGRDVETPQLPDVQSVQHAESVARCLDRATLYERPNRVRPVRADRPLPVRAASQVHKSMRNLIGKPANGNDARCNTASRAVLSPAAAGRSTAAYAKGIAVASGTVVGTAASRCHATAMPSAVAHFAVTHANCIVAAGAAAAAGPATAYTGTAGNAAEGDAAICCSVIAAPTAASGAAATHVTDIVAAGAAGAAAPAPAYSGIADESCSGAHAIRRGSCCTSSACSGSRNCRCW